MNKKQIIFWIFLISIVLTFVPTIIWYENIAFDEVRFINEWLSMWGRGIVIALLFYLITEVIKYFENTDSDKKSMEKVIEILNGIKCLTNNCFDSNKVIIDFNYILQIIGSIRNETKKEKIYKKIMNKKEDIESKLTFRSIDQELIDNLNEIIDSISHEIRK